jgi:hypothetical protein
MQQEISHSLVGKLVRSKITNNIYVIEKAYVSDDKFGKFLKLLAARNINDSGRITASHTELWWEALGSVADWVEEIIDEVQDEFEVIV